MPDETQTIEAAATDEPAAATPTDLELLDGAIEGAASEPAEAAPAAEPAAAAEAKPEAQAEDIPIIVPEETEGEEQAAQAKPAAEEKPAAEPEGPPPTVAKLCAQNAKFKELLAADPKLSGAINAAFRGLERFRRVFPSADEAQQAFEIRQIVASADEARQMQTAAKELGEMDELFQSDDPRSTDALIGRIAAMQVQRDENGNALYDPATGQLVTSGAADRLFDRVLGYAIDKNPLIGLGAALDALRRQAVGQDGQVAHQDLHDAIETITALFPRYAGAKGQNGGETRETPELVKRLTEQAQQAQARVRQIEQEQMNRQAQEARARTSQFYQETKDGLDGHVAKILETSLAGKGFPEKMVRRIANEVNQELTKMAGADADYQARMKLLFQSARGELTPALKTKLTATAKSWINEHVALAAQPVVREFAAMLRANQAAKDEKLAAQQTRREPRSAGGQAGTARTELRAMVQAKQKELGRPLTDLEILNVSS